MHSAAHLEACAEQRLTRTSVTIAFRKPASARTPLRHRVFRMLWIAPVASNIANLHTWEALW